MTASQSSYDNSWFIPGAIIAAGLILALATYSFRHAPSAGISGGNPYLMSPITETDHVIGSPAATVKLVEYADMDSAYSKSFQETMQRVMQDYAATGQVAWVYRHLPLVDQHPYAERNAEASECAASLGGPDTFWRFITILNVQASGSLEFNPSGYPAVITELGLLPQSFNDCMQDGTFKAKVANDFNNGLAVGAGGTPFSILLVKGQPPITIDGAVPYESMKKIVDGAVAKAEK